MCSTTSTTRLGLIDKSKSRSKVQAPRGKGEFQIPGLVPVDYESESGSSLDFTKRRGQNNYKTFVTPFLLLTNYMGYTCNSLT